VRWPGVPPRVDRALHYQFDWAATLLELAGGSVPEGWDGRSFTGDFLAGQEAGRSYLVTSQAAWTCQRGVRFNDCLCLRTYHDGYMDLPPVMLFNVAEDPHEQHDLASSRPDLVARAMVLLNEWHGEMMRSSPTDIDPFMTVLREGGPYQVRRRLARYLERLRATGRVQHAEALAAKHPKEALL
jgi:choline-sulfatase